MLIFLHIGIFLLKLFKKYYKIYILDNDKYMYIKYLDFCCLKIVFLIKSKIFKLKQLIRG